MDTGIRRLLTFALVGVVAQLIDGALGMAYGVTASTLLLSSGATPAVASASVHLAEVGTTFVSGLSHHRFGNVNWRTVRWIGIPGAVGGFAGASVLSNLTAAWVKPAVATLLFLLGVNLVARFAFGVLRKPLKPEHIKGRFLSPLGLGAGFLDAIGGGGWGPVTTPTLMTLGRMEPRTAVGSASASEFLVSLAASLGFLLGLGGQGIDYALVGALLVGGVIAAPIAAWAVRRFPTRVMGTLVGCLVLVTNSRTLMIWAGVPGPTRLAVLLGLVAAGALLVRGSARKVKVAVRAAAAASAAELAAGPGTTAPASAPA